MEARIMAERAAADQRMAEMFQYMQSLGAAQGIAPPPPLFPTVEREIGLHLFLIDFGG